MADAPLIQIGGATKETIEAAAEAIVKVASCSPFKDVCKEAIKALSKLGEIPVNGVTLQDMTVTGGSGAGISARGQSASPRSPSIFGSEHKFEQDNY